MRGFRLYPFFEGTTLPLGANRSLALGFSIIRVNFSFISHLLLVATREKCYFIAVYLTAVGKKKAMTRAKPKRITMKHSMAFSIRINGPPLRYRSETESRVYLVERPALFAK